MPRRVELTDKELRQIRRLARYLTQEQMAETLEVPTRTLQRRLKDDPRAVAAYKKGKADTVAAVARSLIFQAIGGNTTAAIFYLKCQAGWRETDPKQIPLEDLPKLTERELEREKRRMGIVR
jgi:DNA-binding XRE family transcriptional regulator